MSSRLFCNWAGTFFSIGLRALARSHEMRWVGPLFVGLDEMVESGQIRVSVSVSRLR